MTSRARTDWRTRFWRCCWRSRLLCSSVPAQQQADYTFRVQSELVLVNVTVRDKSGNIVRDLKPEDFTILEDNKPQKVVSFDIENIDAVATQDVAQAKPLTGPPSETAKSGERRSTADSANQFKDRRLIVLFFDLSAMEPDEIDRAVTAAEHYVDKQMAPGDLVSIVSLGSSLLVNQDFTSDHDLLKKQLQCVQRGQRPGVRRGHHRHDRRHARHGPAFHRRRHRIQHLQHRPPSGSVALGRRKAFASAAEEVADLFLQWHGPHGH